MSQNGWRKTKNRNKWCCQIKKILKNCWISNCWITGDIVDFQKLIRFSGLSKLMRGIKSKLLTNIYQSLIMTCWKLQLSKKIFLAFEGILESSKDPLKTKQKRTTWLSCWHYLMGQYRSRLTTALYLGIRICFSISEQQFFLASLQISVLHKVQIFRFC